MSNNLQDTLVALTNGVMGGGAYGSNQTNFIFHVSILPVLFFERYIILTNGISYPKFLFAEFDATS